MFWATQYLVYTFATFPKDSETNDTSFESLTVEFYESGTKLGMASSCGWPHPSNWKSKTFTKTRLEPPMIELLSILELLLFTTIRGFLLRYITLSYVIWLKNGKLSKFDENIGIWLVKHYDLYLFLKFIYICILYLKIKINLQ